VSDELARATKFLGLPAVRDDGWLVCERGDCGGDELACVDVPSEAPSGVTARMVPRGPCSQCTACVASAALISLRWRRCESIEAEVPFRHVQRVCGSIDGRGGEDGGRTAASDTGALGLPGCERQRAGMILLAGREPRRPNAPVSSLGQLYAKAACSDDEPARCAQGTARNSEGGGATGCACAACLGRRQWIEDAAGSRAAS
jgi:hypothetical protein